MGRGSCCHLQRHYRWKHHQRPDSCGGCHSHWCTVLVPQDQFDDGLPRDDDSSPCRIPARHRCIRLVLSENSAPRLLHKYKKSDPPKGSLHKYIPESPVILFFFSSSFIW